MSTRRPTSSRSSRRVAEPVPSVRARTPIEQSWADRVRANREQVDRVREVPDGPDFYAPVTSLFRADPRRTDEPVLEVLRAVVAPGETWLDIGAGAGRYALPIALLAGEVIALDPSAGMLEALRDQMAEFDVRNVRPVEGRWPPDAALAAVLGPSPIADVALIAHVGYDVEAIGPFLEAMEGAARRLCVAILMERQPASVADPFWPPVHSESRVPLPALPDFLELLGDRGRKPAVTTVQRQPRTFATRAELAGFLRRQLWIADGGEKERRYRAALEELVVERDEGFGLRDQEPMSVGVVVWRPRTGAAD
jgi:SAM-dependent methyltransferase